jgi:hypothetical protein
MTRAAWSCEPESRIIVMVINVRSLVTGHNVNSVHQERAHLRRKLSALHSRCNAPRCHWRGRWRDNRGARECAGGPLWSASYLLAMAVSTGPKSWIR